MTSGSGSSTGSAHSTVTTFPQTFTFPLIRRRRACAADLWSSYSKKQKPRFFFLSSGWWYKMTSTKPSEKHVFSIKLQKERKKKKSRVYSRTPSLVFCNTQPLNLTPERGREHKKSKTNNRYPSNLPRNRSPSRWNSPEQTYLTIRPCKTSTWTVHTVLVFYILCYNFYILKQSALIRGIFPASRGSWKGFLSHLSKKRRGN